jgi:hypothetical protein
MAFGVFAITVCFNQLDLTSRGLSTFIGKAKVALLIFLTKIACTILGLTQRESNKTGGHPYDSNTTLEIRELFWI